MFGDREGEFKLLTQEHRQKKVSRKQELPYNPFKSECNLHNIYKILKDLNSYVVMFFNNGDNKLRIYFSESTKCYNLRWS